MEKIDLEIFKTKEVYPLGATGLQFAIIEETIKSLHLIASKVNEIVEWINHQQITDINEKVNDTLRQALPCFPQPPHHHHNGSCCFDDPCVYC